MYLIPNLRMEQMFNHLTSKIHPKLETLKTPVFHGSYPQVTQLVHLKRLTSSQVLISVGWVSRSWWNWNQAPLAQSQVRLQKVHNTGVSMPLPPHPPDKYQVLSCGFPPFPASILSRMLGSSSPKPSLISQEQFCDRGWCTQPLLGHYIDSITMVRWKMQLGPPIHNLQLNRIFILWRQ